MRIDATCSRTGRRGRDSDGFWPCELSAPPLMEPRTRTYHSPGPPADIVLTSVADPDPDPNPSDPHVFGPPGSGSGSTDQRYGSADLDAHQNVMDPQHWFYL